MSTFGRYFQGLTAYDLLGNLIPGLIVLGGLYGTAHVELQQIGLVETGASLVVAFIIGGFLQRHASIAAGRRETFDRTIRATRKLSAVSQETTGDEETNEEETDEEQTSSCLERLARLFANRRYLASVLDPLVGWAAEPRGEKLDDAVLTGAIRQHLVDAHGVPKDFDDLQVLYHLMISRVDSTDGPTRATRIQALRNFYRGVWIAVWWFGVLVSVATLLVISFGTNPEPLCGPPPANSVCWMYKRPNFYSWWKDAWQSLLPAVVVLSLAKSSYESQAEDFVEYLFTDYAATIESEQFPTEFRHRLSRDRTPVDPSDGHSNDMDDED